MPAQRSIVFTNAPDDVSIQTAPTLRGAYSPSLPTDMNSRVSVPAVAGPVPASPLAPPLASVPAAPPLVPLAPPSLAPPPPPPVPPVVIMLPAAPPVPDPATGFGG